MFLWIPGNAAAQTVAADTTYYYILRPDFGIHAVSLGDSYPSDSYDTQSMNSNPASLLSLKYSHNLVLSHFYSEQTYSQLDNITAPVYISEDNASAAGVSISHYGNAGLESSLGFSSSSGPRLSFSEFGFNIGVAQAVAKGLSLGTLITGSHATVANRDAWAGTVALGLMYTPDPSISYGFAYRGLGSRLTYSYNTANGQTDVASTNSPDIIALGITLHFLPSFESKEPLFNLTVSNEKIFGRKGIKYSGGFELNPERFLSLRLGYFFGYGQSGARTGIGVHFPDFQIDYMITPDTRPDFFFQQLSISINVDKL